VSISSNFIFLEGKEKEEGKKVFIMPMLVVMKMPRKGEGGGEWGKSSVIGGGL